MKKTIHRINATIAAVLMFVIVCAGCGGGNNMDMNVLVNVPPSVAISSVSKSTVVVDEQSIITVTGLDPNNDSITYEWSVDPGGSLVRLADNSYAFYTVVPGIYTVTVKVSDGQTPLYNSASTSIKCYGLDETYGGFEGTVTIRKTASRAAARPGVERNILTEPITIESEYLRDPTREVLYGNKNAPRSVCESGDFEPGELILKLVSGGPTADFAAARGLSVERQSQDGTALLKLDIGGLADADARQLTVDTCIELDALPEVKFAQLNGIAEFLMLPDDPYYYSQWHYELINLPRAWDITTGGDSVVVGVLDSGIVSGHPDIAGKLYGGYDFVDDPENACDGDGIDSDPEDYADSRCVDGAIPVTSYRHAGYHGTHTSGTIGAATNNGIGVAGINWSGKIMMVRVGGSYGISNYDAMQGMLYAAGLPNDSGVVPAQPARVINMSFGYSPGSGCPADYNEVFNQIHDAGVIAFVSSGNSGRNDAINPISRCDYAMAVGSVDPYGAVAGYSNKGPDLDITAPGGYTGIRESDGVLSTVRFDETANDTGYAFKQGTSMAAPHAAGVAALMIAANPAITPDQIAAIMAQTATDLGDKGTDTVYGAGLINAYAAVLESKKLAQTVAEPLGPQISVSPSRINFRPFETSKTAVISNTGVGRVNISYINIATDIGGGWLDADVDVHTNGVTITAIVDRTGLDPGDYTGRITITSTGGSRRIDISAEVDDPSITPPENCNYYRTVYIAVFNETYDEMLSYDYFLYPVGNYNYFNLPAGAYTVIAGTDCDGDYYICEQGADLCGGYTSYAAPTPISVAGKTSAKNIDITLSPVGGVARTGFRLPAAGAPVNPQPGGININR